VKTQTSEANLGILKLSNPPMPGIDRSKKNFLFDFDIWNVKIGVRMPKLWLFYEQTPNKRTKRSGSGKNLRRSLEIDGNGGKKHTKWTLTRPRPGYQLNTTNSETEICKGYGADGL